MFLGYAPVLQMAEEWGGGGLWWPVPWLGHPSPVDRDPRSRLGTFPSPHLADGALVTS